MELSRADVEKIAKLSRIRLEEAEIDPLAKELAQILTFVERLKAEDVEGIPPTAQAVDLSNVTREDEQKTSTNREAILNAAPRRERDVIEVRAVKTS